MRPDAVRSLLESADRDIAAFHVLREAPGISPETSCFHAQQAVEKTLKAVLVSRGIPYRRVHDLYELGSLVLDTGLSLPIPREDLSLLTPYAVTFRYGPDVDSTITVDEAAILVAEVRS